MRPFLSVVIPAYNEEENLKRGVLSSVYEYLSKQKYSWEVLLVDDCSTDKTAKMLSNFARDHSGFRILNEPHRGKAGTVIAGMLSAEGERVLFTDMDQATPIDQTEKLLSKLENGYDVIIGSRQGRKGAPITRKLMAYGFTLLRTLILRLPFKDTQCGFKAFKRVAVNKILKQMKIFKDGQKVQGSAVTAGFDLELLYIARKLGLRVAEVKVDWFDRGDRGESGVSPFKDSWEGLRDLVKVRINAILGKYKI